MPTATCDLTDHQMEIAEEIIPSRDRCITLTGLAGTGKTTVAQYIHREWVNRGLNVIVMAPTGKAASVLKKKGVEDAKTIHSVIYRLKGKYLDEKGERQLLFDLAEKKRDYNADRYIVDEGSMVTAKQRKDIESKGVQTLWVGDPGQLPPVNSPPNGLFTKDSYILREIHRQARDNPIIRWAHALRKGAPIERAHDGIRHVSCSGQGAFFIAGKMLDLGVDRVITKTNAQRVALNNAVRTITNRRGVLVVGDEIICCLNNWDIGVVNGETFKVVLIHSQEEMNSRVDLLSLDTGYTYPDIDVWHGQFGEEKRIDFEDEVDNHNDYMLADYAYAITCHKMQGSSARHVGITPRGYCGDTCKWNYTAATRAEQEVTVFC